MIPNRIVWGAIVAAMACMNQMGAASVVLNSSSGPDATYNTTVNFTTEGTHDWVYYAGSPRGIVTYAGNEMAGQNLFSDLALTGATAGVVLSGGGYTASQGPTIVYTNGTSPMDNGAGNANNTYARGGGVGDGLTFSYTLGAHTTQILKIYAENFNALGQLTVTSASAGVLYADSEAVALPSSDGTTGPGSGHGAGVYILTLTNDSATDDILTFTYIMAATNGQTRSVGLQGVTVTSSPIPEPGSVVAIGMGAMCLLARRRGAFSQR